MSADNWAECPRCVSQAGQKRAEEQARVDDLYGTVPIEEFLSAQAGLSKADLPNMNTFREDYSVHGPQNGCVTVDYAGSCDKCGLSISFTDYHPIPGIEGGVDER